MCFSLRSTQTVAFGGCISVTDCTLRMNSRQSSNLMSKHRGPRWDKHLHAQTNISTVVTHADIWCLSNTLLFVCFLLAAVDLLHLSLPLVFFYLLHAPPCDDIQRFAVLWVFRPGRGIPHMWLSLRFLLSFYLLKGFFSSFSWLLLRVKGRGCHMGYTNKIWLIDWFLLTCFSMRVEAFPTSQQDSSAVALYRKYHHILLPAPFSSGLTFR